MKRTTALRRELPTAFRIPYRSQMSPHVVRTEAGGYVQVFRLDGASFETADDDVLNNWHERLNVLWRNVAAPNVAVWMHVIRRREQVSAVAGKEEHADFAERLAVRYRRRLSSETLMVNELYLTVVFRPIAGAAPNMIARLLSNRAPQSLAAERIDALDACEKLAQTINSSLARYDPDQLGTYEFKGRHYSRVLEFFGLLLNGEMSQVPLPKAPLHEALATTRVIFGSETIEYRLPTQTRFGAILGIKEYATPTTVGMYNALLSAPFEFVLTQSFSFVSKAAGQSLLQRQYNQMSNAGDFAVSQAEQLKDALDDLTSNEFVMGDHHFTLQVLTGLSPKQSAATTEQRLKALNDDLALARAIVADTGLTTAREDLALEAAFWAQLPACFAMRPRKAPITSRNFCAMAPFHNFPAGRATGNHWGDALALLVTSARSPYHFSLHASDPRDPDGGSRKDTGHTFICGPTGSGKSVLIGFLVTMLARQGATQVLFDKDRGLEILTRALGGTYLPLKNGVSTGFNPLRLPLNPENTEFLKVWLRALVRGQVPLTIREEADLDSALMGTLALDASARRLSRLIEFTDTTRAEGIHARLARWCESSQGAYAWVFDNAEDSLVGELERATLFGVDVTDFLDNALTRAPVTLYLFHVIRQLLDGRRFVCWMDEFWKLLADPAFEGFAKDGPKTWRKLNGVMCLATQSASDVLDSPISRTIIEQTPTKILFPNPDANAADYIEGFGLSQREFKLIKEQLEPGTRQFLIKQGHYSVVCQLDLKGFDAELKVISGRASTVEELHRVLERTGPDPQKWLPVFLNRRLRHEESSRVRIDDRLCGRSAGRAGSNGCRRRSGYRPDAQPVAVHAEPTHHCSQPAHAGTAAVSIHDRLQGHGAAAAGTARNYLPPDWAALAATLQGAQSSYAALAGQMEAALRGNNVLTAAQIAHLTTDQREQLDASRRSVALLQVTSREALQNTSQRFTALQGLIDAIPTATDTKATLDLQARIAAEQAMLQNEHTKLMVLNQAALAEERAQRQRARELAIANYGSLRRLPPVGLAN